MMDETVVDQENRKFWSEPCGSLAAKTWQCEEHSQRSFLHYDNNTFDYYPYLKAHVPLGAMKDKKVLEVGLGYGTLGMAIIQSQAHYTGVDIAEGPIATMQERMRLFKIESRASLHCSSFFDCKLPKNHYDYLVAIGSFHHTGSVEQCIKQSEELLKPGGTLIFMVYNRFSYRQWLRWPLKTLQALLLKEAPPSSHSQVAAYDANTKNEAAPFTEFCSKRQLKNMLKNFSSVRIQKENIGEAKGKLSLIFKRHKLLRIIGPFLGLDLYITAIRKQP